MAEVKFTDTALNYHRSQPPGKPAVIPARPLATRCQNAHAYFHVAADACNVIVADSNRAATVTVRSNFVGVVMNGTTDPKCFEVERSLRDRMIIPVFHDDRHGAAIIVAAAKED